MPYVIKVIRRRIHSKIRDRVQFIVHKLVKKALKYQAMILVDEPTDESIRGLLEEGLNNGLFKVYMAGIRRLVKLLEGQAAWYGVPIRHVRLYSTICPIDGEKLVEIDHRVMKCPECGFTAKRDEVPHGLEEGEEVLYPSGYTPSDYVGFMILNASAHWEGLMNSMFSYYGYYIGYGPTYVVVGYCPVTEIPGPGINIPQFFEEHGCQVKVENDTWLVIEPANICPGG